MKVQVTRSEIRECVEKAVKRVIKEGKSFRGKGDDEREWGKKSNKGNFKQTKVKGNKGNQSWNQYGDDDFDDVLYELSAQTTKK